MQRITLVINQIKGKIKDVIWLFPQHILFRNIIQPIFPCPLKYSSSLFSASKYVFSLFPFEYLLLFKKLSNQMFNLSIDDPLTMKLIAQITLAVIYGIFFNSVVPTNLVLQPSPVNNTQINRLLFTDERTRKVTSVANSITSKCLILVKNLANTNLKELALLMDKDRVKSWIQIFW